MEVEVHSMTLHTLEAEACPGLQKTIIILSAQLLDGSCKLGVVVCGLSSGAGPAVVVVVVVAIPHKAGAGVAGLDVAGVVLVQGVGVDSSVVVIIINFTVVPIVFSGHQQGTCSVGECDSRAASVVQINVCEVASADRGRYGAQHAQCE